MGNLLKNYSTVSKEEKNLCFGLLLSIDSSLSFSFSCYVREERKNVIYRTFSVRSPVVTGGSRDLLRMEERDCSQRANGLRKGAAFFDINFEDT